MAATRTLQVRQSRRLGSAPAKGMLYPLDVLCDRAGIAPPVAKRVSADRIPSPYHDLLVHENEMTSTLERHFGGPVTVRVMTTFSSGGSYFRRVLLALESSGRPVAMGAVRLDLGVFGSRVRTQILRGLVPLGRILRDAGILYESLPMAFLSVTPNADIMGVFWMPGPQTMYGRRTEVRLGEERIGDIVEILPLV